MTQLPDGVSAGTVTVAEPLDPPPAARDPTERDRSRGGRRRRTSCRPRGSSASSMPPPIPDPREPMPIAIEYNGPRDATVDRRLEPREDLSYEGAGARARARRNLARRRRGRVHHDRGPVGLREDDVPQDPGGPPVTLGRQRAPARPRR